MVKKKKEPDIYPMPGAETISPTVEVPPPIVTIPKRKFGGAQPGAGRPKKEADKELIYELSRIQCTLEEIASIVNISVSTLTQRYPDAIKDGKESGKASLRRAQYLKAINGDAACLIWLGKTVLRQKEEKDSSELVDAAVKDLRNLLENVFRAKISNSKLYAKEHSSTPQAPDNALHPSQDPK